MGGVSDPTGVEGGKNRDGTGVPAEGVAVRSAQGIEVRRENGLSQCCSDFVRWADQRSTAVPTNISAWRFWRFSRGYWGPSVWASRTSTTSRVSVSWRQVKRRTRMPLVARLASRSRSRSNAVRDA